jgi:hypothetical protein
MLVRKHAPSGFHSIIAHYILPEERLMTRSGRLDRTTACSESGALDGSDAIEIWPLGHKALDGGD